MKPQGFSLVEVIISTAILAIIIGLGIPSFFDSFKKTQARVATDELLRAIESARTLAVTTNKRTMLLADQANWTEGWTLFIDDNQDGQLNGDEPLKLEKTHLEHVKIHANTHVNEYISFIGTGEGRKLGVNGGGAFQVGTIKICPDAEGAGFALVLSRGGRTRIKKLSAAECAAIP